MTYTLPRSVSGPYPGPHDDTGCALALLTEYAGDHFPSLRSRYSSTYQPRDLLVMAAGTIGDFAAGLFEGRHGTGCPVRAEEDAADLVNARGWLPYCSICREPIHIFAGLSGWQHYRQAELTAPGEAVQADHAPELTWIDPDRCQRRARRCGLLSRRTRQLVRWSLMSART